MRFEFLFETRSMNTVGAKKKVFKKIAIQAQSGDFMINTFLFGQQCWINECRLHPNWEWLLRRFRDTIKHYHGRSIMGLIISSPGRVLFTRERECMVRRCRRHFFHIEPPHHNRSPIFVPPSLLRVFTSVRSNASEMRSDICQQGSYGGLRIPPAREYFDGKICQVWKSPRVLLVHPPVPGRCGASTARSAPVRAGHRLCAASFSPKPFKAKSRLRGHLAKRRSRVECATGADDIWMDGKVAGMNHWSSETLRSDDEH